MQRLIANAGRGRHAEAEEVRTAKEVHTEGREAEGGTSEGARAYGGGLGGLSGADHQMSVGERAEQDVVGVKSGGEGAVAALLVPRRILRQLASLRAVTVIEHAQAR